MLSNLDLQPRGFFLQSGTARIYTGNTISVLRTLPANHFHCVVTSPPYWGLRDYDTAQWIGGDPTCTHVGSIRRTSPPGSSKQASNAGSNDVMAGNCLCGAVRVDYQIGLENTPQEYVESMISVFREVRRVLRDDGVLWLNLGDSYATTPTGNRTPSGISQTSRSRVEVGLQAYNTQPKSFGDCKPKDLIGIPWRVAFALQADGWWLRSDVIWHKLNPMPESIEDRPTSAHEHVFLLTKSSQYYYDAEAIAEESDNGTRNARNVWTIASDPYEGAHFATMPKKLAERCILAGSSEHGACRTCGAPWQRKYIDLGKAPAGNAHGAYATLIPDRPDLNTYQLEKNIKEQNGWEPTCTCTVNYPTPCWVLDPFGGAGTTGLVAGLYARHSVLIELNPKYVLLAQKRLDRNEVPVELVPTKTRRPTRNPT